MKWFVWTDTTFVTFFSIMTASLVLLLFFVLSFVLIKRNDKKYIDRINDESNTIRIYIINAKKNSVTYFNRSDLKNKRTMDLAGFYNHFHKDDSERIKDWVFSICFDSKSAEPYLEASVITGKGKKQYYSLLKLVKYNQQNGTIHLESHLLKYITPTGSVAKSARGVPTGVVKRSQMANMISKEKSLRGFTFSIRFFYIRQKVLSNDKIEKYMTMTLKNQVYPFASSQRYPRQIIDDGDNEVMLFDLRMSNEDDARVLAGSIEHSLRKCIEVNGYAGQINFAIGVVQNQQYYKDFEMITAKAQEACIIAQQKNQNIYIYRKVLGSNISVDSYKEPIDDLMKDGQLRYLYRPIIDVSKKRIMGYFSYLKAYDTAMKNAAELSKRAAETGKNREFLNFVASKVIEKFYNEKNNEYVRLFFYVSLVDLDQMGEVLSQIPFTSKIRLVLVFDEQEINENSNQLELLTSSLDKLKRQEIEIGLSVKDRNLLLGEEFYYRFDYFVVGGANMSEIKKNNRIRLSIHTLIEQLLKYHKSIIATDLDGWQAVELIIKAGLTKVSSDAISESNDMLLPVDKKRMAKLVNIASNFHS